MVTCMFFIPVTPPTTYSCRTNGSYWNRRGVVSVLLTHQRQGLQTKPPGAVVSFNLRTREHPNLFLNYCQRAWGLYLPDMYSAQKV